MRRIGWAALLLAGCSGAEPPVALPPPTPGLEVGAESHIDARERFRTNLVRLGPAPEAAPWPATPPGAVVVGYRSGDLDLRAFASPLGSAAAGRRPGLLFLHGGFALGESGWILSQPFRAAGFIVLTPALRGENGQPGHFSLFYEEVADVLAAAEALASRPDVDPGRLFVAGHSVGGTLTLLAALSSNRFRAAASFSAAPDAVEYTRNRPNRVPFDRTDPAEFRVRSAVAFATGFRPPVRLFYGVDEYWLQPATIRTALLARRAGLDVEAVELEGGHDSVTPASVATCLRFFAAHGSKAR